MIPQNQTKKNRISKKILFILFAIILIFISYLYLIYLLNNSKGELFSIDKATHDYHFFDEKLFYQSLSKIDNSPKITKKNIKGGIVPHHALATELISEFYNRLKNQNIKTVIIVGPNHYETGDFLALSTLESWNTPFGIVENDEKIINNLISNNLVKINDSILDNEHSVALQIPFIKYFLPNAKVVPIIISKKMNIDEAKILSSFLEKYVKQENTVLIASVDFSHYLPMNDAFTKDAESLNEIKNYNFEKIYHFNSDNMDSPPSIITLLMAMKQIKAGNLTLLKNMNSEQIQQTGTNETTSYFTIIYN